jgi:hypothetical protein
MEIKAAIVSERLNIIKYVRFSYYLESNQKAHLLVAG